MCFAAAGNQYHKFGQRLRLFRCVDENEGRRSASLNGHITIYVSCRTIEHNNSTATTTTTIYPLPLYHFYFHHCYHQFHHAPPPPAPTTAPMCTMHQHYTATNNNASTVIFFVSCIYICDFFRGQDTTTYALNYTCKRVPDVFHSPCLSLQLSHPT